MSQVNSRNPTKISPQGAYSNMIIGEAYPDRQPHVPSPPGCLQQQGAIMCPQSGPEEQRPAKANVPPAGRIYYAATSFKQAAVII